LQLKGYDHIIAALLAPDMHAPVFEAATAQVGAEFAGDEGGEAVAAALIGSPGQEGLEVAIEGAIEDGVLGVMALIGRRGTEPGHARAGCSQRAWGRTAEKTDAERTSRRSSGW
jgi:hypothetical protein